MGWLPQTDVRGYEGGTGSAGSGGSVSSEAQAEMGGQDRETTDYETTDYKTTEHGPRRKSREQKVESRNGISLTS